MKRSQSSSRCSLACCLLLLAFSILRLASPIYGQEQSGVKLTVAILEFEDTSPKNEFARLDRALQSMLTTDLSVSRDLLLVERARLEDILAEMKLAKTDFLNPKTVAKVGKGVGANAILTGSFWVRDDEIRIDARLVHVETGTVILAEAITGTATDFTKLEKQLAKKVLEATGVRLSAFETADLSKNHTSNLLAASRYGRALDAEDAGDLDEAKRNAAAALEVDPEFALPQQLLKELEDLLARARDAEFKQKVAFVARFEDSLNGYPFGHPRFKPDEYPQILRDEGPKRALFYWISHAGVNPAMSNLMKGQQTSPYDLLFTHPDALRVSGEISRLYLELGGAEPVLFWCDVVTSDPKYAPVAPLTEEMLNPDVLSRPVWGPYPAYFFWRLPDVYNKRFQAQAWILGDFDKAVETIKSTHRICRPLISEAVYLRELEELNGIISSQQKLSIKRDQAREKQMLWRLAHDEIVDYRAWLQDSRFRQSSKPKRKPNADEVREKLSEDYADQIMAFGGRAAQERQAKQLVQRLLDEAGDSAFIARKTPVFGDGDKANLIDVMHIAGCPHSYLSRQTRIAARLPVPTATSPDVDNGLTTSNDPQDGINNGWAPCPHCRPLRWAKNDAVEEYLAKRLQVVIRDFSEHESEATKRELKCLLAAFQDIPTSKAHDSLQRLCQHVCEQPYGDRKLHATALQSMARITVRDDASWLIALLESTPWWDVRINTAATLATVENDEVYEVLEKAVAREHYYFVKHGLEAALTRARERSIRSRLSRGESQWNGGDVKKARTTLESLLSDIVRDEDLVPPARRRWESHCHWWLSRICYEQGDTTNEIRHLRRVVEMNPENPEHKNSLGYSLARYGQRLDEAEKLLRDAIALDKKQKRDAGETASENPFYLDSLGFVLFKQGQYKEAKELVIRSLDFPEGRLLETYDHLGDIHWALGEKNDAIAAWKKAIEVAKETPFEQDLKATVVKKLQEREAR